MDLLDLLARWGLALVFGSVLLEQVGFPLPAAPILVASGALAASEIMRPELVLLVAFLSCLIADHMWFLLGRRHGRRLLAGLCRLSLSSDTCVRKTDDLIGRHGATVLLVAKFIPGVSAMSIPTAAAIEAPRVRVTIFCSIHRGPIGGQNFLQKSYCDPGLSVLLSHSKPPPAALFAQSD